MNRLKTQTITFILLFTFSASYAVQHPGIFLTSQSVKEIKKSIGKYPAFDKSYYELVYTIYLQLDSICKNKTHSDRIVSVDGKEFIFRNNENKLLNLRKLMTELTTIFVDLYNR